MDGNIVVDGILTSCYASYDHDLAHIGMTPLRLFPVIMNWMFGFENGFPAYIKIAESLDTWISPYTVLV